MSDTIGSLVDKLLTVDLKMWDNQEVLYKVRHMSFKEFKELYLANDIVSEQLWTALKNGCDLNVQRNQLIDEIDQKIIEMISASKTQDLDDGKFIQRKHKTY